jgi:hypothetical protein
MFIFFYSVITFERLCVLTFFFCLADSTSSVAQYLAGLKLANPLAVSDIQMKEGKAESRKRGSDEVINVDGDSTEDYQEEEVKDNDNNEEKERKRKANNERQKKHREKKKFLLDNASMIFFLILFFSFSFLFFLFIEKTEELLEVERKENERLRQMNADLIKQQQLLLLDVELYKSSNNFLDKLPKEEREALLNGGCIFKINMNEDWAQTQNAIYEAEEADGTAFISGGMFPSVFCTYLFISLFFRSFENC